MSEEKLAELKAYLETWSRNKVLTDDKFSTVLEASGGNYDDAYGIGIEDGETHFARIILKKFFS